MLVTSQICRLRHIFTTNARGVCRILICIYVWLCFVKLPETALRDSPAQSWEAVLSFATTHHLQWGREIIFTFGPLGFLMSDHYWGSLFWPILAWALVFALVLALVFARFSHRIAPSIRLVLFVALPLLTTPACQDLGFDPVYFLAITLLGIACLPEEHPSLAQLLVTGFTFGLLSLLKFTFAVYGVYALAVIAASNWSSGSSKNTGILTGAWLASLTAGCWWTGQSITSVPLFFSTSALMSSAYSSAMAIAPRIADLRFGTALLVGLSCLLLAVWLPQKNRLRRADRVVIIAAGVGLAWKEGFVRPDVHVVVFLLYSFLVAALLPALMESDPRIPAADPPPPQSTSPTRMLRVRDQPAILVLTAVILFVSLFPFVSHRKDFAVAVRTGLVPRISETFTAVLAPATFKAQLEHQLMNMRGRVTMPRIRAAVGDRSVAVLSFDQDVAILNGLRYTPHPVFQSYSAYTPELQRLNSAFFDGPQAPEFVLWRPNTLDGRFPTLDDGEVLLKVLAAYSPVMVEKEFVLWQRDVPCARSYSLGRTRERCGPMEEWISIPGEPSWLRVDLTQTWFGAIQNLLFASPEVRIEVRLEDGRTSSYRLLPGNAKSGFVLNPLFQTPLDSTLRGSNPRAPLGVVALRIRASNARCYDKSFRFTLNTIRDLSLLGCESTGIKPVAYSNEN